MTVTTSFDLDAYLRGCRFVYAYLNQGEVWFPKGKPKVRIADMDVEWRHNAANFLLRRAPHLAHRYALGMVQSAAAPAHREVVGEDGGQPVYSGAVFSDLDLMGEHAQDAFDAEQEQITSDPEAWLPTTKLHRALVAGLPKGKKLKRLAVRAAHWSTCPARTGDGPCQCEQIRAEHERTRHLSECPAASGDTETGCTCNDSSPEWTI